MNLNDGDVIEYNHPDLDFQYSDVVYTLDFQGKTYYVCGFMGQEENEWNWTAQVQSKEDEEELDIVEDAEEANKVLIRFFEIMEEAVTKGKKVTPR
tara:strand:+ start:380 stop:667 length:288 start_codon:yes stop_codon:yes gene_type:complete